MVDQDVEKVLAEIRSQVIGASAAETVNASPVNGSQVSSTPVASEATPNSNGYASLTVLARAWDRLPPLVSNRTGTSARLELWLKSKLKRALKWITWEQVNFNAATYHTFLEIVESLNEQHQKLVSLQNELASDREQLALRQRDIEAQREELKTQRAELVSEIKTRCEQIEKQQTALAAVHSLFTELSERFTQLEEEQQTAAETRFKQLVKEFRERDERLLDEQRVCFKQLSLELTESQVLQDRTRRDLEARIANLETEPPAI